MNTLKFDSQTQLKIFFLLINNPSGLQRKQIVKKLCIPRTTVYDNLVIMKKRKIDNISYVKQYRIHTAFRGRPIELFFIPRKIRESFFRIDIPNIKVAGLIVNKKEVI